jgi:Cellulose binding domain
MGSRLSAATRWLGRMARYPEHGPAGDGAGFVLLAGGVGLLLLAGGAVMLLPSHTGHLPQSVAADCGMVTCTATLPASVTGRESLSASPSASPRRTRSTPPSSAAPTRPAVQQSTSAAPAPPDPTHGPVSVPSPSTAPPAPAAVSVTVFYSLDRWFQGIHGQFVIVNHGSAPVTGWNLAVSLPGDGNFQVWNARGHVSGGTLIITAAPDAPALAPGGMQQIGVSAQGGTSNPASCTFDGASVCQEQQREHR